MQPGPYAPPPQQYGAPQQFAAYGPPPPAAPVQVIPQFVDPVIPSAEPGPGWAKLQGRAVAVFVTRIGTSKPFDLRDARADAQGNVPTAWYDLYVVDGGPVAYGAAPKATPPRPFDTHQSATPTVFHGQMTSHVNIYRAMTEAHGKGGYLIGVVDYGKATAGNSPPYVIKAFDDGDPRRQQVIDTVTQILNGRPVPEPVALGAGQAAQQFAPPPAATQQYQQPAQMAPAAPVAPAYPHLPQQPPMAPAPAQPAQQGFQMPPGFPPMPPAPQAGSIVPPEAVAQGMNQQYWDSLSAEQREFYLRSLAPAASAPPANPWG